MKPDPNVTPKLPEWDSNPGPLGWEEAPLKTEQRVYAFALVRLHAFIWELFEPYFHQQLEALRHQDVNFPNLNCITPVMSKQPVAA